MDIAILSADSSTRIGVIVADSLATAQALNPGMVCVARGTGADLTAVDPPAQVAASVAASVAVVTPRQARLALLGAGKLTAVTAALAAMTGVQGEAARITWEYATEIRRDDPLISALAPVLGMSEVQIDALFVQAAGL